MKIFERESPRTRRASIVLLGRSIRRATDCSRAKDQGDGARRCSTRAECRHATLRAVPLARGDAANFPEALPLAPKASRTRDETDSFSSEAESRKFRRT